MTKEEKKSSALKDEVRIDGGRKIHLANIHQHPAPSKTLKWASAHSHQAAHSPRLQKYG